MSAGGFNELSNFLHFRDLYFREDSTVDASWGIQFLSKDEDYLFNCIVHFTPSPLIIFPLSLAIPYPGKGGGKGTPLGVCSAKGYGFLRYFGLKMGIDCNHFSHSLKTGINFTETGIDSRGQS